MRRASLQLLRVALLASITGCGPPYECVDGQSILLANGEPSGFERCADGAINRVTAGTFDPIIPLEACQGDEASHSCETDAECTDAPHGKCISARTPYYGDEGTYCGCVYACMSDADCGTGEACVPSEVTVGSHPTCVAATCTSGADCESGECGFSAFSVGCSYVMSLDCRTTDDTCHGDADCTDGDGDECWSNASESVWECAEYDCDAGRPLLVDGAARVAPPAARHDWSGAPEVVVPLDASVRAALATHWARVAALEHASVGSFARVTMQLLALGAPPELLADTQAAATDEIRHARLAYGLATAYGGVPVGPGRLALADAAPALDPRGVMLALVDEACIGETLGAAELLAAADTCVDTSLAAALRAVAEDEARHAALAWRTLRWLLDEAAPELREEAHAALQAHVEAMRRTPPSAGPHLPEHGVLGPAARASVHAATLDTVIRPCIEACIGRAAA